MSSNLLKVKCKKTGLYVGLSEVPLWSWVLVLVFIGRLRIEKASGVRNEMLRQQRGHS